MDNAPRASIVITDQRVEGKVRSGILRECYVSVAVACRFDDRGVDFSRRGPRVRFAADTLFTPSGANPLALVNTSKDALLPVPGGGQAVQKRIPTVKVDTPPPYEEEDAAQESPDIIWIISVLKKSRSNELLCADALGLWDESIETVRRQLRRDLL